MAMLAIGAGTLLGGTLGSMFGANKQAEAQKEAAEMAAQESRLARQQAAYQAQKAGENMEKKAAEAQSHLTSGMHNQLLALYGGEQLAKQYTERGYDEARGHITGTGAQAEEALKYGASEAKGRLAQMAQLQGYGRKLGSRMDVYDAMAGRQDRLGEMLSRGFSDFQESEGYKFRQQQGEQAINRSAAAQGGRLGGATLKELANFNQGLASQEFDKYAQRKLAMMGQAGASDMSYNQALMAQAGREDAASMAQRQAWGNLANVGYGAQRQLAGLDMAGSGRLAGLYANQGGQLAGLATGEAGALSNQTMQSSTNRANAYGNWGTNSANIDMTTGTNMGNWMMGAASQGTQLAQSMGNVYMQGAQGAGAGWNALGNTLSQLGTMGMMYGMSQGGGGGFGQAWADHGNAYYR